MLLATTIATISSLMSLFKARELWSVNLDTPDAFDGQSILVDYIHGEPCIWVGSHDGYLRAYSPCKEADSAGDLQYETLFPYPVLHVTIGYLVSGSPDRYLAVLHPLSLSIYTISRSQNSLSLALSYQHQLQRSAHSFIVGPFGRLHSRDFICVQSLDGYFTFFEQESVSCSVQLPDVLLPNAFLYLPNTDSFIYQDADWNLKCFPYEQLISKGVPRHSWSHNFGGLLTHLQLLRVDKTQQIFTLTDQNLTNLTENGSIHWERRLEVPALCMHAYIPKHTDSAMYLLILESRFLQVCEGVSIKWVVRLDISPVAVGLIDGVTGIDGVLVFLTDSGVLQCTYLGTQPLLYMIPAPPEPEIDIAAAEQELKKLENSIIENEVDEPSVSASIVIGELSKDDPPVCGVKLNFKTVTPVNNLQAVVEVEPPLAVSVDRHAISTRALSILVPNVVSSEVVQVWVKVVSAGSISSLTLRVTVAYICSTGPKVSRTTAQLPQEVALTPAQPQKDAFSKLSLITPDVPIPPGRLLGGDDSSSAVAVRPVLSDEIVTVLVARTSRRYRVQGDKMHHLTLVVELLREANPGLSFEGPLPIAQYIQCLETLHGLVLQKRHLREKIGQCAAQYRTVQKKVLATLKDVQTPPKMPLYTLLDETYQLMLTHMSQHVQVESELSDALSDLAAMSKLFISLLKMMSISKSDMSTLEKVFDANILIGSQQSWLEWQHALLSVILRTTFSKSAKDQNKTTPLTLDPVVDISHISKLLTSLLDRVTRGSSLIERHEFEHQREEQATVPSVKEWGKEEKEQVLPKGTKLLQLKKQVPDKKPTAEKNFEEEEKSPSPVTEPIPVQQETDEKSIWDINMGDFII